jgi:hypothetical protein
MTFNEAINISSGVLMAPRMNQRTRRGRDSTPATVTPVRTPTPNGEADQVRAIASNESIVMRRSIRSGCDI